MPTNDFLVWAPSGGNVETQANYAADAALANGVIAGIASSKTYNKSIRQSSIFASVWAQFIVARTGQNVLDDGTTAAILANVELAILAQISASYSGSVYTSSDTWTAPRAGTIRIRLIGGGGGSGANPGPSGGTTISINAAANSGCYLEHVMTVNAGDVATITIGAGGIATALSGGVGQPGGDGGSSIIVLDSITLTAPGGQGSPAPAIFVPPFAQAPSTASRVATGGNRVNGRESQGGGAQAFSVGNAYSGPGASVGLFGGGGSWNQAATGYGGGAGGTTVTIGNSSSGGAGAHGWACIEYAV